jgi:hypothetical protein
MATPNEFRFRTIYIVESLPPDERPTGQDLKEELARIAVGRSWFPTVKLLPSSDRATFETHLAAIANETRAKNSGPLLQIETHGSSDQTGLRLASGETITWRELKPLLQQINLPTAMNLLVLMSSCYGSWLFGAIDPGDRAPFWAMIGPDRELSPETLLSSWMEFYKVLFETNDGAIAWRAMNQLEKPQPVTFAFFSAIHVFQLVLYGYFKEYGNVRGIERRAARLHMQWHLFGPPTPPPPFAKWIGAHQWQFAKYWRKFFLIDLYPENALRFHLTYEACRAHPGPLGRFSAV